MVYDTIYNASLPDLVNEVNAAIQDGWRPKGGVAVSTNHDGTQVFHQAMVRIMPMIPEFSAGKPSPETGFSVG